MHPSRETRRIPWAGAALVLAALLLLPAAPLEANEDAQPAHPEDHALAYLDALGVDTGALGHGPFLRDLGLLLAQGEFSRASAMTLAYAGDQVLGGVPVVGQAYKAMRAGQALGTWLRDEQRRIALRRLKELYIKAVGSGPVDWKRLKTPGGGYTDLWETVLKSSDARWVIDALRDTHPAAGQQVLEYMAWERLTGLIELDRTCREAGLDPEQVSASVLRENAQAQLALWLKRQEDAAIKAAARRADARKRLQQVKAGAEKLRALLAKDVGPDALEQALSEDAPKTNAEINTESKAVSADGTYRGVVGAPGKPARKGITLTIEIRGEIVTGTLVVNQQRNKSNSRVRGRYDPRTGKLQLAYKGTGRRYFTVRGGMDTGPSRSGGWQTVACSGRFKGQLKEERFKGRGVMQTAKTQVMRELRIPCWWSAEAVK